MENAERVHRRVIILGSGPAGLTAALYTARAGLSPLVLEGWEPGGQLTITTDVENYPGFPEGIEGPEMMERFRQQAARFGTEFLVGEATRVEFGGDVHRVWVDGARELRCDALIVATGASAKWLGLPSEERFKGWGVSACATCDGSFFKGEVIVVVGGGDTALEEAIYLTRFGSRVVLVHRRASLRASQIMQERALSHPKISFRWNTELDEILGTEENRQKKVTGVRLRDNRDGSLSELSCGAVFVAIGHRPNTDLFVGKLEMDEGGVLVLRGKGTETSVQRVFAAGDVADRVYRQAITAAGTGCMAALDAQRALSHLESLSKVV